MSDVVVTITDSGLGGLSVTAELYEKVKALDVSQNVKIIFVNALPQAGKGYNTMPTNREKIEVFNRVLEEIEERFCPVFIGIACNTLSAIVENTAFYEFHEKKILNIIEIAVESLVKGALDSQGKIVIFGTETTIESGIYEQKLSEAGIKRERLIPIACTRLASEIERDYKSSETETLVKNCVEKSAEFLEGEKGSVSVLLACTHYPYVQNTFRKYFEEQNVSGLRFLNPNNVMVEELLRILKVNLTQLAGKGKGRVEVKVFSKAEILKDEIRSIYSLVSPISPATAEALTKYSE